MNQIKNTLTLPQTWSQPSDSTRLQPERRSSVRPAHLLLVCKHGHYITLIHIYTTCASGLLLSAPPKPFHLCHSAQDAGVCESGGEYPKTQTILFLADPTSVKSYTSKAAVGSFQAWLGQGSPEVADRYWEAIRATLLQALKQKPGVGESLERLWRKTFVWPQGSSGKLLSN